MLFRPARASDLDAICLLLATSRRGAEYYHALFASDPSFEPGQFRVAWTHGGIVACARIYPRAVRIGTVVVPAGGIGNLRTEPHYQQKGLASSLLVECLSALRLDGIALAPLFAPHAVTFPFRGWHALREMDLELSAEALAKTIHIGPTARPRCDPAGVSVRPLEERDLDAVLALHESANVARTGSVVRDCPTWLGSLALLDAQGARPLVAERAGEIVGYVAAQPRGRRVETLELLLAPWAREVWRPLLRAALATAGTATTLYACLPADYRALITDALGESVAVRERDDLRMRMVDPALLLRHIAPLLTTRLRDAFVPEPMRLRIGRLRGGAVLAIAESGVTVETPRRDDPYIISEALFLDLLFGLEDAYARLDDDDTLLLPERARPLLKRLFPPQNWVYWRSDAF